MDEKGLQEIAERFKNNTKYIDDDLACCLGSDFGKLIGEVRKLNELEAEYNTSFTLLQQENQRLNELYDMPIVKTLEESQRYKQALEEIKKRIEDQYHPFKRSCFIDVLLYDIREILGGGKDEWK